MSSAAVPAMDAIVSGTSEVHGRQSVATPDSPFGLPFMDNESPAATAVAGTDVTPTSPSASLLSIKPLPSPSLFAPSSLSSRPGPTAPCPNRENRQSVVSSSPSPPTSPSIISSSSNDKLKENTGRWSSEEHKVFLKGLNEHGKQWKKIAVMIKTRSVVQVRTHAQKYFQKLSKAEKKGENGANVSTSTAASVPTAIEGVVKRKSSTIKGINKTPALSSTGVTKRRKVSLESKKHHGAVPTSRVHHHSGDQNVVDPSFMNTLQMANDDLSDSLLDLLDDSSVEAVEQVIGTDDLEPNPIEMSPNPVSPSASSMSLADSSYPSGNSMRSVNHQNYHYFKDSSQSTGDTVTNGINRNDLVSSPNPTQQLSEDFSIHDKIGTSGRELSPTSVTCMMDIKDFEQKTSNYVDPLDWLMDVGVYQLPASVGETEDNDLYAPSVNSKPISANKLAQVNSSALSVLDDGF